MPYSALSIKWQHMLLLVIVLLWSLPLGAWADSNPNRFQNYDLTGPGPVPNGWTLTGPGAVTASTVDGNTGTQGMALESQDPSNPSTFSQLVNVNQSTEYSVTFWAYRDTSTATQTSNTYNLSLSFGSQVWSIQLSTQWTNYSRTTDVEEGAANIRWTSYDASGAQIIIGLPCFFFANSSYQEPGDEYPSSTSSGIGWDASSADSSNKSTNSAAVVGGAVGGSIGGVLLIAILLGFLRWRQTNKPKQHQKIAAAGSNDLSPADTEEGKAPEEVFIPPWSIPAPRNDSVVHTFPVMATTMNANLARNASTHTTNLARNTSTHTTNLAGNASTHTTNFNESPRDDTMVPSLTYTTSPTTPSPTFISNPPEYGNSPRRSIASGSLSLSHALQLQGMNSLGFIDDEMGRWVAANRDSISPELEQKLRNAHYRPVDDPKEISDTDWKEHYGVGYFELKRIQELYDEWSMASDVKLKDMHGSGQGGTWRASEISS